MLMMKPHVWSEYRFAGGRARRRTSKDPVYVHPPIPAPFLPFPDAGESVVVSTSEDPERTEEAIADSLE